MTMEGTNNVTFFFSTSSEAELSALREEGGENSHARPLTWLVELFLDWSVNLACSPNSRLSNLGSYHRCSGSWYCTSSIVLYSWICWLEMVQALARLRKGFQICSLRCPVPSRFRRTLTDSTEFWTSTNSTNSHSTQRSPPTKVACSDTWTRCLSNPVSISIFFSIIYFKLLISI